MDASARVVTLVVGQLEANCYLVYAAGGDAVVVDPGDEAPRVIDAARKRALTVRAILLTHGHFDHAGAAARLREATGAPVVASVADEALLTGAPSLPRWLCPAEPVSIDVPARDGERVRFGPLEFEVIATPGHTPGSVCYRLGDILFSGDTLFRESVGRTDLGGSLPDLMASLAKLVTLPAATVVYPGHLSETTLEHEMRYNPFFAALRDGRATSFEDA